VVEDTLGEGAEKVWASGCGGVRRGPDPPALAAQETAIHGGR
jgi:hypothetical protein